MKRFFLFLASSLLLFCTSALADSSPKAKLSTMTSVIKSTGNPAIILDFVHWPTAFADLPAQQREVFKATSPEELKGFYKQLFENPGAVLREKAEQSIQAIPPEQQAMARQSIQGMLAQVDEKVAEGREKLKTTEFVVGDETINGNSAIVPLTTTVDGVKKTDSVEFVKIDGEWYLPSMASFEKPLSGEPQSPAPNPVP